MDRRRSFEPGISWIKLDRSSQTEAAEPTGDRSREDVPTGWSLVAKPRGFGGYKAFSGTRTLEESQLEQPLDQERTIFSSEIPQNGTEGFTNSGREKEG